MDSEGTRERETMLAINKEKARLEAEAVRSQIPKYLTAWLLKKLYPKDASDYMLWLSTGKPLE